jgi:hypothetical protein
VRDGGREAGPELLVGGELGERADEQDEGAADLLADTPARHGIAEQLPRRGRRRDETPLLVEHDHGLFEPRDERLGALRVRHHTFTIHSPSIDPSPHAPTR